MKNIAGMRFGRLVALSLTGEKRWGVYLWNCLCDCGKTHVAAVNSLRSGLVQSCGCLRSETARDKATTHGHYGSATYKSWDAMIQRCKNPASTAYKLYGGAGVSVCAEWMEYSTFLADMGPRPKGKTLDRKDAAGNYEPGNCRWATNLEQARNKRKRVTTFEEAEKVRGLYAATRSPKAVSADLGISPGSVNGIVYLGNVSDPLPRGG